MTQVDMTAPAQAPNIRYQLQRIAILAATGLEAVAGLDGKDQSIRPSKGETRRPGRRDRDKIMYTAEWRRLAGVTQVISPDGEDAPVHTRLTHSEKVAQIAWSIGNRLFCDPTVEGEVARARIADHGGLDLDMLEAAAMAHDLGHPPFGHLGESVLDRFAREELHLHDGFEGNAQTFRMLGSLCRWSPADRGLNLTNGTYAAVLKYPWVRELEDTTSFKWTKFGAYQTEAPLLQRVRAWQPIKFRESEKFRDCQSVEANVMDLADDITYAVHDFSDFLISGIVDSKQLERDLKRTVDRLDADESNPTGASNPTDESSPTWFDRTREHLQNKYPNKYNRGEFDEALRGIYGDIKLQSSTDGEEAERRDTKVTSGLITRYIDAVEVLEEPQWPGGPLVVMKGLEWHHMQLLKGVTQDYVIQSPAVAVQQRAEKSMLQRLCQAVLLWAIEDPTRLPSSLRYRISYSSQPGCNQPLWEAVNRHLIQPNRDRIEEATNELKQKNGPGLWVPCPPERHIVDFLAGLTDRAARSLYLRLEGGVTEQIAPYALL